MSPSRNVIVVPCYNEAERLPVDEFRRYLRQRPPACLLLVDDGSSDSTRRLHAQLAREHARHCFAAALSRNSGKAEAVRQGLRLALDRGAATVGYWDADLAAGLDEIEDLLNALERRPEVVAVLGVRLPMAGRHIDRHPLRRALSLGCRLAASGVLRVALRDTQCGAKVFRAGDGLRRALGWPFASRWLFDVELLLRLQRLAPWEHGQWLEHPLHRWSERAGSKVRPADYARALADALRLHAAYRRRDAAERTEQRGLLASVPASLAVDSADHRMAA